MGQKTHEEVSRDCQVKNQAAFCQHFRRGGGTKCASIKAASIKRENDEKSRTQSTGRQGIESQQNSLKGRRNNPLWKYCDKDSQPWLTGETHSPTLLS